MYREPDRDLPPHSPPPEADSHASAVAGAARPAADRGPVVDTHLHGFAGKDDRRFPHHTDAPYAPDAPATPEHLLARMKDAGFDFTVVHPELYQYGRVRDILPTV